MTGEGLRELKKRETRQRISDIATELFLSRGFEHVTVGEVAAAAGVSEKTVFNYFPSKESLVLDQIEGQIERLAGAVRDRPRSMTPTAALVAAIRAEGRRFLQAVSPEATARLEQFSAMVRGTPALRAAWSEHRHALVAALTAVLAAELQVDEADPEPLVAARALAGLLELFYDSRLRHGGAGRPEEQLALISADLDRGARLLDTGMWSLQLMIEGRRTHEQIQDAAAAAERARRQVMAAVREAKRAWKQISGAR